MSFAGSPLFVWTGPREDRGVYGEWAKRGVQGVFLEGFHRDDVRAIRDAGMEPHVWMWTLNRTEPELREKHPEMFAVSRSGKSCATDPPYVPYYRWLVPARDDVRAYLGDRAEEILADADVAGLHLDYVRYPDVILPRGLWDRYGLDQTEELPDYDFGYDPVTLSAFEREFGRAPGENPAADQQWIAFRHRTVNRLVDELTARARAHRKPISAAVFPTPSLARTICRQDWSAWSLDAFCPMTYHSFYLEDAAWIGDAVRECVQATTAPILAGLFMPAFGSPEEFRLGIQAARRRGARGLSLFGEVPNEMWDVVDSEMR